MDLVLQHKTLIRDPKADWVVFLHGVGGGSAIWFKQLKAFRKHFNLLLVDLPGHGGSRFGLKDFKQRTFSAIAEQVVRVLDVHGITKAHFVGISLGTIVIQVIHAIQPKIVASMILGGAVEKVQLPIRMILSVINTVKKWIPYMWLYRICAWILMPRKHHKESREVFIKEACKIGQTEFIPWFELLSKQIEPFSRMIATMKTANTPKLYVMGSEDYMFLPFVQKRVKQTKDAILHVIEKCGHVCNIEKDKEFNELSLSFLQSLSSTIHSLPNSSRGEL